MAFVENKITLPTKMGKIMGLILIFLTPYLLVTYLREFGFFTSIWIAVFVWLPFLILAATYIYLWIKEDEKNTSEEKMLEIMKERNQIENARNHIEMRKM